jgi:lipopolysaccharide biosynthesis glycosyltransferase
MLVPAMFVAVAAKSARMRLRDRYDVIIVTGKGDATDTQRKWLAERGVDIRDDLDLSPLRGIEIKLRRLSQATLYRLLLAPRFAGRYEKILYLDADIMLRDEIGAIFELDTGAFALGVVPAGRLWAGVSKAEQEQRVAHFRALGMSEPYRFFNNGMMLIDVAKWNRDEVGTRAIDFARRNPEVCQLVDEDALNATLDGRQAELSPLWNMRAGIWAYTELRETLRPVVIHYDGANKPWRKFARGRRMFDLHDIYREYRAFLRDTPWSGWLATQWRYSDVYHNLLFELRHHSRRLRGKPTGRDATERSAYVAGYKQYCAEARFADVDQGIVVRDGARLSLR